MASVLDGTIEIVVAALNNSFPFNTDRNNPSKRNGQITQFIEDVYLKLNELNALSGEEKNKETQEKR